MLSPLRPGSHVKTSTCLRRTVPRRAGSTLPKSVPLSKYVWSTRPLGGFRQPRHTDDLMESQLRHLRSRLQDGAEQSDSSKSSRSSRSPEHRSPGSAQGDQRTYSVFTRLVHSKLDQFFKMEGTWAERKSAYQAAGVETPLDFDREAKAFRAAVQAACRLASDKNATTKSRNPLFWSLRNAFVQGDVSRLSQELNFSFMAFLMRSRFSKTVSATHRAMADFRFPYEWFPATRAMQRTIHLHVGPTNSGKTYNALKALENAKSGIYAGPLRLLAHEVYSRFVAKGKTCALITGEEQRIPENEDMYFRSCTVEMTPLNLPVDVAVIDEIQMIGDEDRGWAWTQAFLGVQAKELHLCGEDRTVDLIQSLCDTIGDKCVVHRYERLSGLETMDSSLRGGFKDLQKGDCVVSFSRIGIHALKRAIQKATGRQCAIVYGSLPPETRAQQAALFNDPDNEYDYLVASDAIGMGLNLEIKRVVFEATHKRTLTGFRMMTTSEIKQIGGRAGRYKTAAAAIRDARLPAMPSSSSASARSVGQVTAFDAEDLSIIRQAFEARPQPILTAGLQPPLSIVERFTAYFPPNTPFSYMLFRLNELCKIGSRFHLCSRTEILQVADLIQPFPMSIYDRCVFLNAPVALREHRGRAVLQAYARCVSSMGGGDLLDIPELDLELLDQDKDTYQEGPAQYLRHLEALHKAISLYLWLSYRFTGVFPSQKLAFHVKSLIEAKIDEHLEELSTDMAGVAKRRAEIRKKIAKQEAARQALGDDMDNSETVLSAHEEPLFDVKPGVEGMVQHASPTRQSRASA